MKGNTKEVLTLDPFFLGGEVGEMWIFENWWFSDTEHGNRAYYFPLSFSYIYIFCIYSMWALCLVLKVLW